MQKWIACCIWTLWLSACLLLGGCAESIERATENLRSYKFVHAPMEAPRPPSVGVALKAAPMERFPKDFKSTFPHKGSGTWEGNVKPLFDPLGGQSAYEHVQRNYSWDNFGYMDADYRQVSQLVGGDFWRYHFVVDTFDTDSFDCMRHLEKYAMDLGCQILSPAGTEMAFFCPGKAHAWWGKFTASATSDGKQNIRVELWREQQLPAGQPLKVVAGMGNGKLLYFSTEHTDGKFQSMKLEITPGRGQSIKAHFSRQVGAYSKKISYSRYLYPESAPGGVFHMDDIPQEPGKLLWEISTDAYYLPEGRSLTFTLSDVADMPPVHYGEALGALLVKGAPWGSVSVDLNSRSTHKTTTTRHAELSVGQSALVGQTGDGDTLLWLPSGYWDLKIANHWNRLVPISAGELTIVTAPTTLRRQEEKGAEEEVAQEKPLKEQGLSFLAVPRESEDKVEVDILLFDSDDKNPQPTKDNVVLNENGLAAKVLSIEPLKLPPNVVLLLDSSGSMKGQLEATLATAKKFVEGLPEDASIQVVQFASTVKAFSGTTKAQALTNIDTIKLGGSTALYGATVQGLEMLQGKERPTLVLFTDGKNEPAKGGLQDKSVVLGAIARAKVPIYTIGFGPEHAPPKPPKANPHAPPVELKLPPSDIRDFALLSEGKYYSAADQDALAKVFDAISARIGKAFTVSYQRPKVSSLPDVPVVMLVIDNSGSMGEQLEEGTKMEALKAMYRQFLLDAPDNTLMQAMDFDFVDFQMLTTAKASMLSGLSSMVSGGGTDISETTRRGYQSLMDVSTSRRVLIYVTDEAMINPASDKTYAKLLEKLKKDSIQSLWVGLMAQPEYYRATFQQAAEVSGGRYVVSRDAKTLNEALVDMLAAMRAPMTSKESHIALQILLGEAGAKRSFIGATRAQLKPMPPAPSTTAPPEAMKLATGLPLEGLFVQEKPKAAPKVALPSTSPSKAPKVASPSPSPSPSTDTQVVSRTPLKASGKSTAVEIRATELHHLSKLRGISPPAGMVYRALQLELKNLFDDRPFQIPNIGSHFYITLDDLDSYPASTATWLAPTPLTVPGAHELTLPKGESKTGMLVFLTAEGEPKALQLSFYDTQYGHIQMPLMGSPKGVNVPLEQLPTVAPTKLSDSFSLAITGYSDLVRIGSHPAPSGMVYRIVEGQIVSKVQALLDLRPGERLFMDIATQSGAFRLPISPVTNMVPMGYVSPKMLAPGSANTFRWVFEVPAPLALAKAEIYGDIRGEPLRIPVKGGTPFPGGQNPSRYSGKEIDLTVNELGLLSEKDYNKLLQSFKMTAEQQAKEDSKAEHRGQEEVAPAEEPAWDYSKKFYVVADMTVTDKPDGYGTGSLHTAFRFAREEVSAGQAAADASGGLGNFASKSSTVSQDGLTSQLALGVDNTFVVHDGESRRGLVVFELKGKDFVLNSPFFPKLQLPVPTRAYSKTALMRPKVQPSTAEHAFARALNAEIERVVAQYQAANPTQVVQKVQKMSSGGFRVDTPPGTSEVPAPSLALYGTRQLAAPRTLEEVLAKLQSLAWRPSYAGKTSAWVTRYAPEAVLTQGWGTEFDLAMVAEKLLAQAGFKPQRMQLALTKKGQQALRDYLKLAPPATGGEENTKPAPLPLADFNSLPALYYRDGKGAGHVLVVPFMKALSSLEGYAYVQGPGTSVPGTEYPKANIQVVVEALPLSAQAKSSGGGALNTGGLFGSLGGAVTGEEIQAKPKEITVLEQSFTLAELSMNAVDVGFALGDDRAWVAWMDTPSGRKPSKTAIDKKDFQPTRVRYTVSVGKERYTHEVTLADNERLDGIFSTLGINLPELHGEGLDALNKTVQAFPKEQNPDDISSLRWFTRNKLYRFIAGQTATEDAMAKDLGLVIGRSNKTRCIAVTARRQGENSKLRTEIDLMGVFNQVHNGAKELQHAFNIYSGLAVSGLEGQVLGKGAVALGDIWKKRPKEAQFHFLGNEGWKENLPLLREMGYPETLLRRMEQGYKAKGKDIMYVVTDKPSKVDGKERWAMLEVDGKSFETISVLDNGGNGSTVDYLLMNLSDLDHGIYLGYGAGYMVGVSTGIWSFCAASLIESDYGEVVKLAKEYAGQVGEAVNRLFGGVTAATIHGGFRAGQKPLSMLVNNNGEVGGPGDGFKDGLKAYMDRVSGAQ